MKEIEFADGAVEIDASIVAEGLGIALPRLKEGMRNGTITSLSERGVDADQGRHRLTFFSEHRRFRGICVWRADSPRQHPRVRDGRGTLRRDHDDRRPRARAGAAADSS